MVARGGGSQAAPAEHARVQLWPAGTPLACWRAFLIDLDGVIYRGQEPLPGAADLLAYLERTGRSYRLVTNNSRLLACAVRGAARRHGHAGAERGRRHGGSGDGGVSAAGGADPARGYS